MESFKVFAEKKGGSFPVLEAEFMGMFNEFVETVNGKAYQNNHEFGIMENKVKYAVIITYGKTLVMQEKNKQEPLMNLWESIMENYNKESPESCNKGM